MHEIGIILDSIMLPEAGLFLAFIILILFLWVILRRLKGLKRNVSSLELGRLEMAYLSSEMREWRSRLINTDRTNMKDLQARSDEVLNFFERIGFWVREGILSKKEIRQSFGTPILGYFSFLVPYIQWLRMEKRFPELYLYFEDLNEVVYRLNRKMGRRRAHPLMEEEELNLFIEEEKASLSD